MVKTFGAPKFLNQFKFMSSSFLIPVRKNFSSGAGGLREWIVMRESKLMKSFIDSSPPFDLLGSGRRDDVDDAVAVVGDETDDDEGKVLLDDVDDVGILC